MYPHENRLTIMGRLDEIARARDFVAAIARDVGLDDKSVHHCILAVDETCTNIIEHAYGATAGRVRVAFTFLDDPRRLAIDFDDSGQSFDLAQVQSPNLDEAQTSGYGIFLIRRLMDEVDYRPAPGNNRWRLVKRLE